MSAALFTAAMADLRAKHAVVVAGLRAEKTALSDELFHLRREAAKLRATVDDMTAAAAESADTLEQVVAMLLTDEGAAALAAEYAEAVAEIRRLRAERRAA
jgi:hypothetical protein